MSDRVHDYYRESNEGTPGHFHKVIALHEDKHLDWDKISDEIPTLSRGWFELSQLIKEDRMEFTREFWLSKFSNVQVSDLDFENRLDLFFEKLDDIGLFATQEAKKGPFELHMVYCFKENSGFFHGAPPAELEVLSNLTKQFANFSLPPDYLAFLSVHDGFSKYTDTGMIRARDMARSYLRFAQANASEIILGPEGQLLDPKNIIPFYESFSLHCYQCFCAEWAPEGEMGNIYYAETDETRFDFFYHTSLDEHFAFTSFQGWLLSYLDGMGHI